jgi:hypothetical protein
MPSKDASACPQKRSRLHEGLLSGGQLMKIAAQFLPPTMPQKDDHSRFVFFKDKKENPGYNGGSAGSTFSA